MNIFLALITYVISEQKNENDLKRSQIVGGPLGPYGTAPYGPTPYGAGYPGAF